jgi:serine/threonine protein kinase
MADMIPGWTITKELGSGHFAKVKLGTRNHDGLKAAIKIIKKPKGGPVRPAEPQTVMLLVLQVASWHLCKLKWIF